VVAQPPPFPTLTACGVEVGVLIGVVAVLSTPEPPPPDIPPPEPPAPPPAIITYSHVSLNPALVVNTPGEVNV
jgi:hypothetical protein